MCGCNKIGKTSTMKKFDIMGALTKTLKVGGGAIVGNMIADQIPASETAKGIGLAFAGTIGVGLLAKGKKGKGLMDDIGAGLVAAGATRLWNANAGSLGLNGLFGYPNVGGYGSMGNISDGYAINGNGGGVPQTTMSYS